MNKKILYNILTAFFGAVFLFCLIWLGKYAWDAYHNQDQYNNLASLHGTQATPVPGTTIGTTAPTVPPTTSIPPISIPTTGPALPTIPTVPTAPTTEATVPPTTTVPVPTQPSILPEMQALYDLNPHTVGWIKIENTKIDYPVLQTPNTSQWRDYYLYRDFYGKDNKNGSIYVREACDVFTPSDNVVIYGHHMATGKMFGDLNYYWTRGRSFYEDHKYIQFDTLYERHTYEIFAIFVTSGTYGEGFAFHLFNDAKDEAAFDEFVAECKRLSRYKIDITPQYGDKLICLTTCNYTITNGRLVVVAVRID